MICPTCGQEMIAFGCRVSDRPFHHCANCGTAKPCDDTPFLVPVLVEEGRAFAEAFRKEEEGRLARAALPIVRKLAEEAEAELREHMRGVDSHDPNPVPAIVKRLQAEGRQARPHVHEAGQPPNPIDRCGLCGRDIRDDIHPTIQPHTYERAGAPNWGCMECGLPPEHPIHTRGNHGQSKD